MKHKSEPVLALLETFTPVERKPTVEPPQIDTMMIRRCRQVRVFKFSKFSQICRDFSKLEKRSQKYWREMINYDSGTKLQNFL